MSKKTKEILFWLVMLTSFITFICSFPSCTSTKRVEQAKYTTQTTLAEESIEVNGKEDVTIYDSVNDTSVIVTLTPIIDVPFSSPKDILTQGLNSAGYKVKEVKIEAKTTKQAITTINQTKKIQTKKSADLTGVETTTVKSEKKSNRNILPFIMFAFCSCCGCLFYFLLKKNNKIWR